MEKAILCGLYLAKYDSRGLQELGFSGFEEAFNALGYAVGSPPASIKNYRDEFDPLFPNVRKGWHKRPTREYCLKVLAEYDGLDFDAFTLLVRSFGSRPEDSPEDSSFAKRLITGLAAEQYFESVHGALSEFSGCIAENTTRLGCGYDFRLRRPAAEEFVAVEVKGLRERSGSLALTEKEHATAAALAGNYYLFVVKNFQEQPYHEIYRDPVSGGLDFRKIERTIIQISWTTVV